MTLEQHAKTIITVTLFAKIDTMIPCDIRCDRCPSLDKIGNFNSLEKRIK